MRFLILDEYYPLYLTQVYREAPQLACAPYRDQWDRIMQGRFGVSDVYSYQLRKLGHEAQEIVLNGEALQLAWAREHSLSLPRHWEWKTWHGISFPIPTITSWYLEILSAQIKSVKPDILYVQCPGSLPNGFLYEHRQHYRLLVGQMASRYSPTCDFSDYHLMVSSFPHYVDRFRQAGLKARYLQLAFDERILSEMVRAEITSDVAFIGGLSAVHGERIDWLESLAKNRHFDFWGYGFDRAGLETKRQCTNHGEVWGLSMYEALVSTKICLNQHPASVADRYANNMRLYEATGVGTLLLTDWRENLDALFLPDIEIVTWRDPRECLEKIDWLLAHPTQAHDIAQAGQRRNCKAHTYTHRIPELVGYILEVMP